MRTEDEQQLATRMRKMVEVVDSPPHNFASRARKAHRGRRRKLRGSAAIGMLAVAVLAGGIVLRAEGRAAPASFGGALVVKSGSLVTVSGLVILPSGGLPTLCAPGSARSAGPSSCAGDSLLLSHVDVTKLASRYTSRSGSFGYSTFSGIWHPGRLTVSNQQAGAPPGQGLGATSPVHEGPSPCTSPPGGWPSGVPNWQPIYAYQAAHRSSLVALTTWRPERLVVPTLTTTDPSGAKAALDPTVGSQICIVPSKYSVEQVVTTQRALGNVLSLGLPKSAAPADDIGFTAQVDNAGQESITVFALLMDPALQKLLSQTPPGLVQARFWINRK